MSTLRFYIIFWFKLFREVFHLKSVRIDIERFTGKIVKFKLNQISAQGIIPRLVSKILNLNKIRFMLDDIKHISNIYNILGDQYSKKILIEILVARILGFWRVSLPLNNENYWRIRNNLKKLIIGKEKINTDGFELELFDLKKVGIPIKLYSISLGIMTSFILEQYQYKHSKKILVEEGDIVIDAGGCWGDTTLFFANKVTNSGLVYSFEFIPRNLNILEKNLNLNPELKKIVTIVKNPLWKISDKYLNFVESGPSSKIILKSTKPDKNCVVKSISIDRFIKKNNIEKVDYIKMDIEGAELQALMGAKFVLQTYKPKLAISIYHNIKDFYNIPQYLLSLNLNYKFFIDHFTTYLEETVLFAIID